MNTKKRTLTIDHPWTLELSQNVFDSIHAVSQATGLPVESLVAQAVNTNWPSVAAQKKTRKERIMLMLRERLSLANVASILAVSVASVHALAPPRNDEKQREVIEHLAAGASDRETNRKTGVSRSTIAKIRREHFPHQSGVAKHRCPECGILIDSPECLACKAAAA